MAYTVHSGDTLSGIASRHRTSVAALMRANPAISNPNLIRVGQRLSIPGSTDSYTPVAPSTRRAGSYVVRSGDTLGGIAQRHGTSAGAIAELNGIQNPNLIHPGQVLQMPGGAPAPTAPSSPRPTGHIYTVRSGDTLGGIASRFGVSMNALASTNNIHNPNLIYPGQRLSIPGSTPAQPVQPVNPGSGRPGDVTPAQLRAICPSITTANANLYAPYLNQAMREYNINTPERRRMFIAQLAHETAGFRTMTEYASGAAYEGRADLGNTQPGDGVRYKGRGAIQLTGRHNYTRAGQALGLNLVGNPERAADPDVAFRIAGWYWNSRNINAKADAGDFIGVTRAINGGTNGLTNRQYYLARARDVI